MAAFDDVRNAASRTSLAWQRTALGYLTLAGTVVLVSAHRHQLGLGLVGAAWLTVSAIVVTSRREARRFAPPGHVDTTRVALVGGSTVITAVFALLLLLVGD